MSAQRQYPYPVPEERRLLRSLPVFKREPDSRAQRSIPAPRLPEGVKK